LALVGNYAYFGVTAASVDLGTGWLAVAACGLLGGGLGGLFSRVLIRAAIGLPGRFGRWTRAHPYQFAALCGAVIAAAGLVSHGATYGTGYAQASSLVSARGELPAWFFAAKLVATIASYLSGIPGGIFAPSLSIGAGLGQALTALMPGTPAGALVLLGMVGYFAGVVQAPITATVIVMEMTENQHMTIPLLATAMLAYATSRLVCRRPLYGALARHFLRGLPH
jgi:H+/Cl- antiporter ClcA